MKTFKQLLEGVIQPNGTDKIKVENLKDTCWKGYTAIGTKKKNGREVPNCVPEEVEVNEENGNYSVTIHHTYPDGKKEQFNYKVGAAKSAKHAKNIAMQKHGQKKLPMHSYGADSSDVKKLDEGKMAQLHADIEDHLGKHVANYKKMGGAEHLGNKTVEVAKKIAKLHNISHEAAQKHVNDYVDQNLKESDASWAASQEKKKEDRLTDKDKGTLGKIRDLMDKEKAKKSVKEQTEQEKAAAELKLKLTKWKNQQRAAKALGEAVDKEHPIYKEYQSLKKQPLKDLKDHIKRQHRIIDTSEFRSKEHAVSHILHTKHGAHRMKAVFGEETEQLDELSKSTLASYVNKSAADATGNASYIGAMRNSGSNTVDKAYDKLKKRRMGIASATAKLAKEEVEQIDEAYRLPSDSEIDKVKAHVKANHPNKSLAQVAVHKQSKKIEYVIKDKEGKMTGHTLGEEVEQINEISKDTLHSYIHKAFAQGNDLHYDLAHSRGDKATDAERKALQAKISKRNTGIMKAGKKLREDVSMLSFEDYLKEQKACKKEELHPNQKKLDKNNNGKLDSDDFVKLRAGKTKEVDEKYVSDAQRKAVWASKNEKGVKEEAELDEAMTPMQKLKDALDRHSEKAVAANKAGDHEAVKVHQGYMNKIKTKMGKLAKNEEVDLQEMEELCETGKVYDPITKKMVDRKSIKTKMGGGATRNGVPVTGSTAPVKEEIEQIDELSKKTLGSYVKKASTDAAKREVRIDRAMDASGSNYNEPSMQKALNKNAKRFAGISKAADKLAKEETEQIDEISKQTLASYIPKAAQSARFSGMTAQHYANKSDRARNKGMQNAYHSLSMKYKNKAWDREANIKKAAQKLAKEEKLDELSKKTLQSYQSKIGHDLDRAMDAMPHGTGNDKEDRKLNNRMVGDERAQKRLMKKEETDVITFKDLMQNISEAKIDDLKDKLAARKATQSAYDKDYKPAAKSNVQKVKGHSYGAGEEEGEDDEDTKKVSKPAAPEVKRGRGRPAGSKSGARN
jgi:hypothetical protein